MTTIRDDEASDAPETRPQSGGALGELIEVEEQIARQLADAEAQAEKIVAEASRSAQTDEHGLEAAFAEEVAALRVSIEAECAAKLRALTEGAEAEAEFYRDVDDATVERMANWVVSRLLGGSEAP